MIINNPNLYKVYKKPTDFYFLKNNKFLEEVIYDLRFIEKYDNADFFRMMILMDAFLKTYFSIPLYFLSWVGILKHKSIKKVRI